MQENLTPSGRKINPDKKLGRPKGAVTTTEIKFSELLKILCGVNSAKSVQDCLQANNLGMVAEQRVTVGIKWAEARGFVFKQESFRETLTPAPQRPKFEGRADVEEVDFDKE